MAINWNPSSILRNSHIVDEYPLQFYSLMYVHCSHIYIYLHIFSYIYIYIHIVDIYSSYRWSYSTCAGARGPAVAKVTMGFSLQWQWIGNGLSSSFFFPWTLKMAILVFHQSINTCIYTVYVYNFYTYKYIYIYTGIGEYERSRRP